MHFIPITLAISRCSTDLCTVLYVDGTGLLLLGDVNTSTLTLGNCLQEAVTCWADGLRVSGGALKVSKCVNYLIGYSFQKGR